MSWKKISLILSAALVSAALIIPVSPVAAATTNYSNLLDDAVFDNYRTLSAAQIDAFLNTFPTSCLSTNNGFTAPDPTGYTPTASDANGIYSYGGAVSAGRVIYDAATGHHMNPQVILATLEKEEGLVSGGAGCSSWRYASALGYGCTDSGTSTHTYSYPHGGLVTPLYFINGQAVDSITNSCVNRADRAGFSEQVVHAAWLLSFTRHRSAGESNWAIVSTSWNHCDDNNTCPTSMRIPSSWACYSWGFMIRGTWARCTGGSTTFYDGLATIDGSSIQIDNGTTAAFYDYTPHKSGNDHFDTIFTSWFGSVRATPFFKISTGAAVYVLGTNNNYYHVPSETMLTRYGFGSHFSTIDTFTSAYLSGLTNSGDLLGVAQFDGTGSVYLVDQGVLHAFPDNSTLTAFGFTVGHQAQLPGWIRDKLTISGQSVATVVHVTNSAATYFVDAGRRSHITSNTAFTTLGSPTYASRPSVTLSNNYVGSLPVGPPIMVANTITFSSDTHAYGLWDGAGLQPISTVTGQSIELGPDYTTTAAALAQLPVSANPTLGKLAKDSGGTYYLLDTRKKLTVDSGQLATAGLNAGSFITTSDGFLARFSTAPLTDLVQVSGSLPIFSLLSGKLYHVFSNIDFAGLGYSYANVTNVDQTTLHLFTNSGLQLFAQGRLLRIGSSPMVYLIDGNFMKHSIGSLDMFNQFGFTMSRVTSVPSSALNGYASGPSLVQVNKDNGGTFWLIDSGLKHTIASGLLDAAHYNINQAGTTVLSDQTLGAVASGPDLTDLLRTPGSAAIYKIESGHKRRFSSFTSYKNSGDTSPIISVSSAYLASLPDGAPI